MTELTHTSEHRDYTGSKLGMWLFLFTEILLFGGLFLVYAVYRYVNAGLTATLDLEAGTLEIVNETGRDLPEPDFYVLDARDGTQTDGKVDAPTGVPSGETKTFDVSLNGIAVEDIGLAVLLIGPDNYGAFVPQ